MTSYAGELEFKTFISNEAQSERLQRILFNLDIYWASQGKNVCCHRGYLYVENFHGPLYIFYGESSSKFNNSPLPFYKAKDVIDYWECGVCYTSEFVEIMDVYKVCSKCATREVIG